MIETILQNRLLVLARQEVRGLVPSAAVTLDLGEDTYTWLRTGLRLEPLLSYARKDVTAHGQTDLADYHLLGLIAGSVVYVAPAFPDAEPDTMYCPACGRSYDHRAFIGWIDPETEEPKYRSTCESCRNARDRNSHQLHVATREERNRRLDEAVADMLKAQPWRSNESTRQALRQQGVRVGWGRVKDMRQKLQSDGVLPNLPGHLGDDGKVRWTKAFHEAQD
jgi:hypothetical protein